MKESSNIIGKLCYYGKEIVLVLQKNKIGSNRILNKEYDSYDVLFCKGAIDRVSAKRLNVID